MKGVFIQGIEYELGESRSIAEVEELGRDEELLETLLALGLESYRKSSLSPAAMAGAAARRTLERTGVAPSDVQAVVYASTTFWRDDFFKNDIGHLMADLQLDRAYPTGVYLSECANLYSALRTGVALMKSEDLRHVLVLVADVFSEAQSRILPPSISVRSDAASSFMISRDAGQFRILDVRQRIEPELYRVHPERDFNDYFKLSMRGISQICADTLARVERQPADFEKFITNNYNLSVLRVFAQQTGFSAGQLFSENIARCAHAIASDNLINLRDLCEAAPPRAGSLFFLLGSGGKMWGTTVLQAC
jgi:3-oxoacyl-[acyl-carrier-protein] synthase III